MKELLIGCGSRRDKLMWQDKQYREWQNLVTLDINPDHSPDIIWDLNKRPLPFDDETFTEIHAYEVLEHLGNGPGDYQSWFDEWTEWWRLLKPGGFIMGTSPALHSRWLWGDPSHRRVVSKEAMVFLIQPQYDEQVGKTPMSDFRYIYRADFDAQVFEDQDQTFCFCLNAVKPSRCTR